MLILHGDNQVLSRQELTTKTQSFSGEVIFLSAEKVTLTDLVQAFESSSLLGQDRLVVIEGIFGLRPSKNKEEISKYLRQNNPANLILWEKKKIDGRKLVSLKGAKIKRFDLGAVIFKFLDALAPANSKTCLNLFHQCLSKDPPELIFYMLSTRLAHLIIAADLGPRGLKQMAGWQKARLSQQAKRFTLARLVSLYRQLLDIESQSKTGQTPFPLISQLDLFLASL